MDGCHKNWHSHLGSRLNNTPLRIHNLMLQILSSQTTRSIIFKFAHVNPYLLARAKSTIGTLPLPPPFSSLANSDESNEARKWIAMFKSESISRGSVEFSFSRSSGPGGQVCSTCSYRFVIYDRMRIGFYRM